MRALVISGGGSKGAFAGGVSQYLIEECKHDYGLFVGSSTGSLLVSHLALGHIEKIKEAYTSVSPEKIFSNFPFVITRKKDNIIFGINHLNVIKNFFRKSKTFGESKNLLKYIKTIFSEKDYKKLQESKKEVLITVSNISLNSTEYKSCKDVSYDDFCQWTWISCNYVPFMSLVNKDGFDYADGGLGMIVPIEEAINRGAKEIDVIILETQTGLINRMPAKNPFSLLDNTFGYILSRIEKQNIRIGKIKAKEENVKLNIYHTPQVLTSSPLIFIKEQMNAWWEIGYNYAKERNQNKDTN